MEVITDRWGDLKTAQATTKSFGDLYIDLGGATPVALKDLYIIQKGKDAKHPDNFAEFLLNLRAGRISSDDVGSHLLPKRTDVFLEDVVNVPSLHETTKSLTSSDAVPYGLKRTYKAQESATGDFYYTKINNKWEFVDKNGIHFYDGASKIFLVDYLTTHTPEDIKTNNLILFDAEERTIEEIFTETTYELPKVVKYEEMDVSALTKTTYKVTESDFGDLEEVDKIENLTSTYSMQHFETKTVDDEKKPGKTKNISVVKMKNFKADLNGNFIAVNVDGHVKMVDVKSITKSDGSALLRGDGSAYEVADYLTYIYNNVGEEIYFKEGEKVLHSAPITHEQSQVRYSSLHTYQKVETGVTENSCLRLETGKYVKEMQTLQPLAYRLAVSGEAYDKILVQQTVGTETKWVIVDKEYFTRYGSSSGFDLSSVKYVKRCNIRSRDCVAVQRTSKGEKVEECKLISTTLEKKEEYEAFKTAYKNGEYQVDGAYLDETDNLTKLAQGNARYEYTDEVELGDPASELSQYKALKTNALTIEKGQVKGGPKFSFGKATKAGYAKLAENVTTFFVPTVVVGMALPVVGPILFGAAATTAVGFAVGIPVVNTIRKIASSTARTSVSVGKFKDKTEHNRKVYEKEIKKEIENLYANREKFNETEFLDQYEKIMNKVAMYSQTGSNNSLVVKDGKVAVTEHNANLASKFKAQYNKLSKEIASLDKEIKKCLDKDGNVKKKYKDKHATLTAEKATKEAEFNALKTGVKGESYKADKRGEKLAKKANDMQLADYVNRNIDDLKLDPSVASIPGALDLLDKVKWSYKKGITIDGVKIDTEDGKLPKKMDATAFRLVANLINSKKTDLESMSMGEPDECSTEAGLTELETIDNLILDIQAQIVLAEEKCNNAFAGLAGINAYIELGEEVSTSLYDLLQDVISLVNLATNDKTIDELTSLKADVEAKIAEIDNLNTFVTYFADEAQEIDKLKEEFNALVIELNKVIPSYPITSKQTAYLDKVQTMQNAVNEAYNQALECSNINDLFKQFEIIKNNKIEAEKHLEKINNQIAKLSLENCLKDILAQATLARGVYNSIKDNDYTTTIFKGELHKVDGLISVFRNELKDKDITLETALKVRNKTISVLNIMKIASSIVQAFEHYLPEIDNDKIKDELVSKTLSIKDALALSGEISEEVLADIEKNIKQDKKDFDAIIDKWRLMRTEEKTKGKTTGTPTSSAPKTPSLKTMAGNKTLRTAEGNLEALLKICLDLYKADNLFQEQEFGSQQAEALQFFNAYQSKTGKSNDEVIEMFEATMKMIQAKHPQNKLASNSRNNDIKYVIWLYTDGKDIELDAIEKFGGI